MNDWRPLKRFTNERLAYGLNVSAADYVPDGVRLLRTTDISGSQPIGSEGVYVERAVAAPLMLREADLLFSRSGSLGKAHLHETIHGAATFAAYLVRLRPDSSSTDSRYIAYCAQARFFEDQIHADAVVSTIANFNAERYANLRVPWHPLNEQRAIADFLDRETVRIDALIAKKKQLVARLVLKMDALVKHEVLRGLNPATGQGATDLPPNWRTGRLGVAARLQRGADLSDEFRQPGEVPVVSSGGISGTHNVALDKAPGVVTGRTGSIGKVYWIEVDYWPHNTALYVKNFRGNIPRWVYYLLSALPFEIDSAKTAVTGVDRNVIEQLRVPIPPIDEQQRIARYLDDAIRRIQTTQMTMESQLALLTERRQSLVTAAVIGEIAIPSAA